MKLPSIPTFIVIVVTILTLHDRCTHMQPPPESMKRQRASNDYSTTLIREKPPMRQKTAIPVSNKITEFAAISPSEKDWSKYSKDEIMRARHEAAHAVILAKVSESYKTAYTLVSVSIIKTDTEGGNTKIICENEIAKLYCKSAGMASSYKSGDPCKYLKSEDYQPDYANVKKICQKNNWDMCEVFEHCIRLVQKFQPEIDGLADRLLREKTIIF